MYDLQTDICFELKNVYKIFNEGKRNQKIALADINFSVQNGEIIAILGKSGAGKTTLINIISCRETLTRGAVLSRGKEIDFFSEKENAYIRNKVVGYVEQTPFLIENLSAIENVKIPLLIAKEKIGIANQQAADALKSVGMGDYINTKVEVLSGGERQRVSIARAIVNEPDIIIADEPTGALDDVTAESILNIFKKLNKKGKTIIIVTHNTEIAKICNRNIELSNGTIIKDSIKEQK